jgi:hypothetical protein
VVEIEVGLHDVPDVAGIEAQRADLRDRRQARVDLGPRVEVGEPAAEPGGDVGVVRRTQPGVHQDQPVGRGLDQEHVAGQRRSAQRHRGDVGAVEVVHAQGGAHGRLLLSQQFVAIVTVSARRR